MCEYGDGVSAAPGAPYSSHGICAARAVRPVRWAAAEPCGPMMAARSTRHEPPELLGVHGGGGLFANAWAEDQAENSSSDGRSSRTKAGPEGGSRTRHQSWDAINCTARRATSRYCQAWTHSGPPTGVWRPRDTTSAADNAQRHATTKILLSAARTHGAGAMWGRIGDKTRLLKCYGDRSYVLTEFLCSSSQVSSFAGWATAGPQRRGHVPNVH